jgi:adenosylcobyric acid synthase
VFDGAERIEMTRTILVAGTASHVGKSTVAAGLCRLLADRGTDVAPYKAQNMSNNARAVATPGEEFGEIGVSQYTQAWAARVPATTDMNPVLLKPRGAGESQLVIQGQAIGHLAAGEYYEKHWERARAAARESFERLAAEHEVVIAEGAGSIAEINLHDRDLANVETARFADSEILLLVDIERGGAFASLYGTIELLPPDLRERLLGALITKFRGDRELLKPGIEAIEARTDVPILGVLPYDDPGLPAEDSLSLPAAGSTALFGAEDGIAHEESVTVAVPRLPHVSNFTDMGPLAREPGVRVAYLPLDAPLETASANGSQEGDGGGNGKRSSTGSQRPRSFGGVDAVVIPGTKNTVDDLLALREAGFGDSLRAFDGPIVGLCGGYQLLGERLTNAAREGTGEVEVLDGLSLLPIETRFEEEKTVRPVSRRLRGCGPLAGANGAVAGYEIHHGRTELLDEAIERPFEGEGAATDRVLGTYLHGLFENPSARDGFLDSVFAHAGKRRPAPDGETDRSPYDRAAALLDRVALDALDP